MLSVSLLRRPLPLLSTKMYFQRFLSDISGNNFIDGSTLKMNNTRGKKLKPMKPNIVVLNPREAGLIKSGKKNRSHLHHLENGEQHLSILEGVDISDMRMFNNVLKSRNMKTNKNNNDENDFLQLMKLQLPSTTEQINQSIDSLKPPTTDISDLNYQGLVTRLKDSYTAKQLRQYIKVHNPTVKCLAHTVKSKLISLILDNIWKLRISENLLSKVISLKEIKLNERDAKLLILTQNGKILKNLSRLNKNLIIQLDLITNELKIWNDDDSLLKYIEISLSNILKNVEVTNWNLPPTINSNEMTKCSDDNIIHLITKICGVDINIDKNEIAAFGKKRIDLAKRLMIWANSKRLRDSDKKQNIENQDQVEVWGLNNDEDQMTNKLFPFNDLQCLDWLNNRATWGRLQAVLPLKKGTKGVQQPTVATGVQLLSNNMNNSKINKMYDFLTGGNSNKSENMEATNIVSITFGQVLSPMESSKDISDGNTCIFVPKVPHLSTKLMKLPLSNEITSRDEIFSVDQHDYYLQLIFTKRPADKDRATVPQNLELWLELDENDKIISNSVQCIKPLQKKNYVIQTPSLPNDYQISSEKFVNIPTGSDVQPGIAKYVQDIQETMNAAKINPPPSISISDPEDPKRKTTYDYITLKQNKVLRLKYLDKYHVQYSEIDGGVTGGKFSQVDFIADEQKNPTREEFHQFINDIFNF